jgi:nitrate reductase beta subunit
MTEKVDHEGVLAVFAAWCNEKNIGRVEYEKRGAVYDAVSNLIESVKELRQRQRDYLADPKEARSNDKGRLVGIAAERVDAALSRLEPHP